MQRTGPAEEVGKLILAVTRPVIEELDLFVPMKDGSVRRLRAGFNCVKVSDALAHWFPALIIPPDFRDAGPVYLRVRTKVACYSIRLFNQDTFDRRGRYDYLLFGLIAGVMPSMFLYNLTLALFLRERIYGAYCIYILCMNCDTALLSGWPLGLGLNPAIHMALILKLCTASFFFGAHFSRLFLATRRNTPILDRLLQILMAGAVVAFVLSTAGFFDAANRISYILGIVGPVIILIGASIRWHQGYQSARYYLAAWLVLIVSVVVHSTTGLGLIGYSFPVYNLPGLGGAVESILLSFALADRIRILRKERQRLKEQERRLTELSITDELNGLYNKRWFSSKIISEIDHARRVDRPLSLILMDLDEFKKINDRYGHAVGDQVLAEVGRTIAAALRERDIPCRYGGEEFAVILPGAGRVEAAAIAERLRLSFGRMRVTVPRGGTVRATVSLGVTKLNGQDDLDALFARADQALYQAKSRGRNRVVAL